MKIASYWVLMVFVVGCVTTPETGKRKLILTSADQENALGAQAFEEILVKETLSTNRRWNDILQRVGKRVAAAAHQPDFKWEFRLIESKQKNAFALPGGKVAFYTGIYSVAQTEAGLAAIMGHEVAHATARHAGQRMTVALGTELGLMGLSAILGGQDTEQKRLVLAALGIGAQVGATLPFSRSNEAEADEIGIIYMARAGYDPAAAPTLWARFAQMTGDGGPPSFLSTHPSNEQRKHALQKLVPNASAIYERSARYGQGETL